MQLRESENRLCPPPTKEAAGNPHPEMHESEGERRLHPITVPPPYMMVQQ